MESDPSPPRELPLFDPSLELKHFFEKLDLSGKALDGFAFGKDNHEQLADGKKCLIVWIWAADVSSKQDGRIFWVCASSEHVFGDGGHRSEKDELRCCFTSRGGWLGSTIFWSSDKSDKKCGVGVYRARTECNVDVCKRFNQKWLPVTIFRKDGPEKFVSPPKRLVLRPTTYFDLSCETTDLPLLHEGIFPVDEKVFGRVLHDAVPYEDSTRQVYVYGEKEKMRTKDKKLHDKGFICSGITHLSSPSMKSFFAFQVGAYWYKALAVIIDDVETNCCGSPFYAYKVVT